MSSKPGRNDPCPCGSGKKYKKCCLEQDLAAESHALAEDREYAAEAAFGAIGGGERSVGDLQSHRVRRTEDVLAPELMRHAEKYYGDQGIRDAYDEFTLWGDVELNPEFDEEAVLPFFPWYFYDWTPDNAEKRKRDHLPEMPVAMHYLEHQGERLDALKQRFIEACCAEAFSFFSVIDVNPGKNMTLRDQLVDREFFVEERLGSQDIGKGWILYAKIVVVDGIASMSGCAPRIFPPEFLATFIDMRESFDEQGVERDVELLKDYDYELRSLYFEFREAVTNPETPELQNTDGEAIQLTTLHYTLKCTPTEAVDALCTLALVKSVDDLPTDEEPRFDAKGQLQAIAFPWLRKGNQNHRGWESTVMGRLRIDGKRLTIDVNSAERAESARRRINRRLGKRATYRLAEINSHEKMLEDMQHHEPLPGLPVAGGSQAGRGAALPPDVNLEQHPDVQAALKSMAEKHWKEWLDVPLPALRGDTPREAAKTRVGRERLEALLLMFADDDRPDNPMAPNVPALRRALGME